MHLTKNYLTRKLYCFKGGWRVNFLCVSRDFKISKVVFIFSIINRKNIKFQIKVYQTTLRRSEPNG